MYELYLTLKQLLLLPGAPLIVAVLGLLLLARRPRLGRGLAGLGVAVLVVASLPAVPAALARVEPPAPLASDARCEAVVVLGGGVAHAPEYGGSTVAADTLVRLRYGARLARRRDLPVLVAGGSPTGADPAEAPIMARVMEEEFGIPVRWVEDRSRNTLENARGAMAILAPEGIGRVCLVTEGRHIGRATQAFALAGFDVVPAPTNLAPPWTPELRDFVPSPGGLHASNRLLHEWLGRGWQWLRDALAL